MRLLLILFLSVLHFGCEMADNKGRLVAQAFGNSLTMDDLSEELIFASSKTDSLNIIHSRVDQWLMSQILLKEAKKNLKDNTDIKKLVAGYENELFIQQFEKEILRSSLGMQISAVEVDSFLSQHGEEFILQEPLVKVLFVKLTGTGDETFEELWKTEDLPGLQTYVSQKGGFSLLNLDKWHPKSMITTMMPDTLIRSVNFNKSKSHHVKLKEHSYYIKVLEKLDKDSLPPREYVRADIEKRILRQRSKEILKDERSKMYQTYIKSKDISIKQLDI